MRLRFNIHPGFLIIGHLFYATWGLANVYLHFALAFWFQKRVKAHCRGDAFILRYADDFLCAFRYREEAERFYQALPDRLHKFNLEVAPEKTENFAVQPLSSWNAKAN